MFAGCLVVRLLVKTMVEHGFCSSFDLYRWCADYHYTLLFIVNGEPLRRFQIVRLLCL